MAQNYTIPKFRFYNIWTQYKFPGYESFLELPYCSIFVLWEINQDQLIDTVISMWGLTFCLSKKNGSLVSSSSFCERGVLFSMQLLVRKLGWFLFMVLVLLHAMYNFFFYRSRNSPSLAIFSTVKVFLLNPWDQCPS